jgi:hypothetical protein
VVLAAGCGTAAAPSTTAAAPATTAALTTTTVAPAAASPAATPPGEAIAVPAGAAPVIDGTIGDAEWAGSAVAAGDGLDLWWRTDGTLLYVAVRREGAGSVNLVLAEGDAIRILHSSAALGSARYVRSAGTAWDLVEDFDWCCRVPGDPAAAALLDDAGWTASPGTVGAPGDVEFAVRPGSAGMRVAVSSVGPDGRAVIWPGDLPGDQQEALYGPRPATALFDPDGWPRLVVGG